MEETTDKCLDGPMAKKHAGDKKLLDKKKKDKKKTLKRLWCYHYWNKIINIYMYS